LLELHRFGLRTNAGIAEELNARGVATEHGRAWVVQTVASLRYRMLVMGADPPQARVLPPRRRRRQGRARANPTPV
jgi:hypothetical protein